MFVLMVKKKTVPKGVKLVSLYYFIISALTMLVALIVGVVGSIVVNIIEIEQAWMSIVGTAGLIVIGIIFAVFSVLYFIVGKSLRKGKYWAWIVAIVLSSVGVLSSFTAIAGGDFFLSPFKLLINGGILYYLGFNEEGKAYFKTNTKKKKKKK